jgi:hypothetical protein
VNSVLKMLTVICLFTVGVAFGQSNFVVDSDEYHYVAKFDPGRISKGHLQELLLLSPYEFGDHGWKIDHAEVSTAWSQESGRVEKIAIPNQLELCIETDPRYRPCGKRDISDPNFFANAEINVSRNEQSLAALNRLVAPTELQNILQQFRDSLLFHSTIERRRLEYLRTGDLRLLSRPIGAFDPSAQCSKEIRELNVAATLPRRYELSRYAWQNCVNSVWQEASPAYRREAWSSFLRAYGITEQFTNKPVD